MMTDNYVRLRNRSDHPERVITHKEYIFDLGEHPVRPENKARFRDTYPTTRPEYNDHAFTMKIDGKDRQVRLPAQIAREIHIQIESEAHPINFHQKLQPNYVAGQGHGPNKVGKMTVQNVSYYNSIQSAMQLPNYFRQKGWAIQNAIFDEHMKYRQVNGDDYPHIADIDYSEEVATKVFESYDSGKKKPKGKGKKADVKNKAKKDERIPKLKKDKMSYKRVINALPHIKEYIVTDDEGEDDDDDMEDDEEDEPTTDAVDLTKENDRRKRNGKIQKHKLVKKNRLSTSNAERSGVVTRSAERLSKTRKTDASGSHSLSDPSNARGRKRKQLSFEEGEIDETEEATPAFDLFASKSPKKDWDTHPEMKKLMKIGHANMKEIGFSSPKPDSQNVTMHEIARKYNVSLPRRREDAEPILVRALAIVRIKQMDNNAVNSYTDLKSGSSK